MVSHDCVAFYLLSEEVAKHVKVVQSGQGADEVFAGYDWYPPLAEVPRERRRRARTRAVFFDRAARRAGALLQPERLPSGDPSRAFVAEHFAAPGRRDRARRGAAASTRTIMLVDDPVKRVDNMTMAWGLEARVPFLDHELVELAAALPARAQARRTAARACSRRRRAGSLPDEVIDRPKGYFPVPAIRHLAGAFLELVTRRARRPARRKRPRPVPPRAGWTRLLADPNTERTHLGSNALWQVALLELWLQERGI